MHHANLLIGSREWGHAHIPEEERMQSPDISLRSYERMTIADARALIHDAQLRPVVRTYRTFILDVQVLLPEAQNALLKLLEEPDAGARFFLIIPREEVLLPTLRSRFDLLAREHAPIDTAVFDAFRALAPRERLKGIVEKLDEEDREWVRSLLQGAALHAEALHDPVFMRDVLATEAYIVSPGASKKILLEHLALSIPEK